jgi:hypothetical protein
MTLRSDGDGQRRCPRLPDLAVPPPSERRRGQSAGWVALTPSRLIAGTRYPAGGQKTRGSCHKISKAMMKSPLATSGITRRRLLGALAGGAAAALAAFRPLAAQTSTPIVVYKDPSCGCCTAWVTHMNANGFKATVHEGAMEPVHAKYKIPLALQSCHTGVIGNYVIEGHVPAADVRRLLREKRAGIAGLTIPDMPASAPGMDQKPFQPFTVLAFAAQGQTTVFAKHDRA